MREIWMIFRTMSPADGLDILLVATPFYVIFALLREARSFVALWGIVSMLVVSFVLYLVATVGGLRATALIYERFWIIVVLIFLIVFQNELKKAMTDVGRLRLFRRLFQEEKQAVEEVLQAVKEMSDYRVGAIIAIERGNSLKPYMTQGTVLDAAVSAEALRAIFTPLSPLHDGAVIIRGERLVAASCILPLSDNPNLSKQLGTRHLAAIGLTEETDAVVITVSEETGGISVTRDGKMERFLSVEEARARLERELNLPSRAQGEAVHA